MSGKRWDDPTSSPIEDIQGYLKLVAANVAAPPPPPPLYLPARVYDQAVEEGYIDGDGNIDHTKVSVPFFRAARL